MAAETFSMFIEITVLCIFAFLFQSTALQPHISVGTFWHITDMHLDFYYLKDSNDLKEVCPSSNKNSALNPGQWGDYRCDSPLKLIESAIQAMRKTDPTPDFILWTGDDTLHTPDEHIYLSESLVLETVANITQLLKAAFPNTIVLSALGNHDYHPKYQMPPHPNNILNGIADLWAGWMTADQYLQFKKTGFCERTLSAQNLKVIILNTNLWDLDNQIVSRTEDPANQFAWLEEQLQSSRNNQQVYIIGHIGPGFYERVTGESYYHPQYNERYVDLMIKYSDVIAGQFFGHHHSDSFRLFRDQGSNLTVSSLFYAPSVTPRIGFRDGSVNPSIRLFQYDRFTSIPLDYTQYYLDLSAANSNGRPDWTEEYSALREYGLADLSPFSLAELSSRLHAADPDCPDCDGNSALLQRYNLLNTVSYSHGACDQLCKKRHVCSIRNLKLREYSRCMSDTYDTLYSSVLGVVFIVTFALMLQLYVF